MHRIGDGETRIGWAVVELEELSRNTVMETMNAIRKLKWVEPACPPFCEVRLQSSQLAIKLSSVCYRNQLSDSCALTLGRIHGFVTA